MPDVDIYQKAVVEHRSGPACVAAAPGSGKTSTLIRRVIALLEAGTPPQQILTITFSRSAARTFRSRLAPMTTKVPVRTFHSEALHVILSPPLSWRLDPLLSESASLSLWHELLGPRTRHCPQAIGPLRDALDPEAVASAIELVRVARENPEEHPSLSPVFQAAARAFRIAKRARRVIDYSDLVLMALDVLERSEDLLALHTPSALIVDEAQDTNPSQMRLVELLGKGAESLVVVGDPNQAIYGFQGADPTAITKFSTRFPGASLYTLPHTYRCSHSVSAVANALIPKASEMVPATPMRGMVGTIAHLQDYDEAPWLAEEVLKLQTESPGLSILVLARTNMDLEPPAAALRRLNIPFRRQGGASAFWGLPEVDGTLDMARVAANPLDMIAACRLAAWPPRQQLTYTAQIRSILREGGPPAGYRALADSDFAALRVEHLLVPALNANENSHPRDLITRMIDSEIWRLMLPSWLSVERAETNLGILSSIARKTNSIESLLTCATSSASQEAEDLPSVTLSTAHGAKGMEADLVFVLGMTRGRWPHSKSISERALAEERRLLYVATTRARSICVWSTYEKRGNIKVAPSPYLEEVQSSLGLPTLSGSLVDWLDWSTANTMHSAL